MITYGFEFYILRYFLMILLPLLIASNNRKSFEVTKAGTIIAIINVGYFLISFFLYALVKSSVDYVLNGKADIKIYRCLIIFLMLCSLIPTKDRV